MYFKIKRSGEQKSMAPAYCFEASFFADYKQNIGVIRFQNLFITVPRKTSKNNKPQGPIRTLKL